MISRRTLETAGFFTIAAALHVSAAAIMLPDRLERGAAVEAPPAALSAGGDEIRSMVEAWEAPPETQAAPDIAAPQPPPEPAPQPAAPEPAPRQVAAAPLAPPDPTPAQPNLPPPPEPMAPEPDPIDPAELDLPDLQQLSPPAIKTASPLALEASSRPGRRPARQPRPEPEPRRATAPSPQPAREAPAQAQPAQRAGEGGQSQRSSAGGGGGGVSAETRASAMAQWTAQIATCIGRQFSRVSGARGGRIVVNISIARNGRVQGATLISGTGDARVDGQVVRTAQRLRACPAAPAAVIGPLHTFTTPFTLG